jgi:hypothetical protein
LPSLAAFFGGLDTLQRVQDPRRSAGSRVRVASLVDLAGISLVDLAGISLVDLAGEDESDSGSRQLEGLCGHSRSRIEWNRSRDGIGGKGNRQKL